MKNWYQSKIVWASVVMFLISALQLFQGWYAAGDFSVPSIIGLVVSILIIVVRVWFTDTAIDTPKARAKQIDERMDYLS